MAAFLCEEIQDGLRRLDELAQAQGLLVPSHGSRLDGPARSINLIYRVLCDNKIHKDSQRTKIQQFLACCYRAFHRKNRLRSQKSSNTWHFLSILLQQLATYGIINT
jgi:hypothetical protein